MIMASSSSRDLVLRWVGDTSKLVASTKDVDKAVDKSAKNAEDKGDKAGKGFGSKFSGGIKSVAGKLALGMGALFAFDKIKDFAKGAYDEAREAQKVGAQTNAVIKSTGGVAKVTTKSVSDLATAISNKTGIDDEQIQAGENMLLTFTNIRNGMGKSNKVFDQSTQILTDMSVATGQDMTKSAVMLGKALNNPTKGVSALSRVGVTFTDQQKKQIEQMQKAGDTMGAQKIILGELRKEFGGSAAAQATAGEKLQATWKNFQEEVGTAVLPVIDKLFGLIQRVGIPALQGLMKPILSLIPPLVKVAAQIFPALIAIVKALVPVLVSVIKAIMPLVTQLLPPFVDLVKALLPIITALVPIISLLAKVLGFLVGWIAKILAVGVRMVAMFLKWILNMNAVKRSMTALWKVIVDGAKSVLGWFTSKFLPFFTKTLPKIFSDLLGWVKRNWPTILAIITGPIGLAVLAVVKNWNKIKNAFKAVKDWVAGAWRKGWSGVSGWISDHVGKGSDRSGRFLTNMKDRFQSVKSWVSSTWRKGWSAISGWISDGVGKGRDRVSNFLGSMKDRFSNIKGWVSTTWRKGWAGISGWISDAVGRGRDRTSNFMGSVRDHLARVKDWAATSWRKSWANIKDWIAHPVQSARDAVAAAKERIRGSLNVLDDWGRHIFGKRWANIRDTLVKPFTAARDAIARIMGKNGLRKTLTNALSGLGSQLVKQIGNPIRSAINGIFHVINVGLIRNGINWLLGKLGVQKKNQLPWIPVNIPKLAAGGRLKGANAYQRGGTDRIPLLGDRDEMMIGRGAVRALDQALPGGLDYLNKYGKWPVGPAAETGGAYQNTPRGPNAPVNMNGIPPHLAAIIRRGPRQNDRSGWGGPNPVAFGQSHVGDMGWYNRCLAFVNAAWNFTVGRFRVATARQSAMAGPRNMRGMPPAGAGVYWDTGPAGHIALAGGDGSVFSNDIRQAGRIDRVPQQEINKWGPYMGWWHPNGANTANAGWNPGGKPSGILGALGNLAQWIGNRDPIDWLKKKVASFAHDAGIAGGIFGRGLAGTVPGLIIGRAKTWLTNKFGGGSATGSIGAMSGWNRDQLANAATIIGVARSLGFGDRGAQIALITAMQESTLRNLNYGDRDSLGLFQQRTPWGSARDRTTPSVAARMFLLGGHGGQPGLRAFPWRTMGLAQAAQAVQVSAFPGAYAKWIGQAGAMLGKFKSFDTGGRLPRGVSLAYNGTGQSERVLSPAEERRYGATTVINIQVDGTLNDDRTIGRLVRAIEAYERRRGPVIVRRAAA